MSSLQEIEHTVQRTAEAISDVLKIEVEIADSNLVRVAGTGHYKDQCGSVMLDGFVYQHVLNTGNTILIENPGYHELCQPCPRKENCFENAEMATPILAQGRVVGVIGLISFDPIQAKRLLDNREWMLQFIVKMAELIANNLPEKISNDDQVPPLNLENLEKEAIVKALDEVAGNVRSKEKAAKLLGISRATLYRKIREYEIL
ncbi:MAG: transcriptional regulator containing AAA-type ATPase, and DNA-binding domain [Firmicutes bacterium]|jgi:transcriptional regulator with PAS, ATPase and Fis domain|nr:transcriptional regulator containing AAA-type ATPase, and DNA-binding domain [Bacillota bacterium]